MPQYSSHLLFTSHPSAWHPLFCTSFLCPCEDGVATKVYSNDYLFTPKYLNFPHLSHILRGNFNRIAHLFPIAPLPSAPKRPSFTNPTSESPSASLHTHVDPWEVAPDSRIRRRCGPQPEAGGPTPRPGAPTRLSLSPLLLVFPSPFSSTLRAKWSVLTIYPCSNVPPLPSLFARHV